MKTKSFIALSMLAAATMLASCNKAPLAPEDGLDGYMTLQVVGQMDATTKTTPGDDGTETGTAAENGITSLLVLLCDTGGTVQHSYSVDESDLTATSTGVKTSPIETELGTFYVYVVANPPASFTAPTTVGTTTVTNVTEALMKSNYAADSKFMMFNECNGTDDTQGEAITIAADNDFDHPATCNTIALDRLAVKIVPKTASIDISAITTSTPGTTPAEFSAVTAITLQGFKLLNGATQSNLRQQWSQAAPTGTATTEPWFNNLITPALDNSATGYYNNISQYRTIATDAAGDYTLAQDNYTAVGYYDTSSQTAPVYCMENNPSYDGTVTKSALIGNTTGLVFHFKATVTGSDEKAGANCFYAYDGKYYATLEAIQQEYAGVFDTGAGNTATEQLTAAQNELQTAYNSGTPDEQAIGKFRAKYRVKVYTDGNIYYTYFIKDENYKDADNGDKYYSVMRNTVYNLNITALSRIGTDIPGGWNPDADPDDPVNPDNVYMVVSVSVNDWVVSNTDVTLQ